MGFKLGRYKTLPGIATSGKLNKKFNFKIEHKDLEEGVTAEAVSKDKIVIDKDVPKDSDLYKRAVAHEAVHCKEMAEGRIAYGDDWVRADGKTYPRKDGMIKYNGEWHEEGSKVFPWEQRAMRAEAPFKHSVTVDGHGHRDAGKVDYTKFAREEEKRKNLPSM